MLKQLLDQVHGQAKARARKTVLDLASLAASLDMKETAAGLHQTEQRLGSDTFQIIVAGRFKNGKSTLLNALLGRTTRPVPELSVGHGPMPVGDLPCTATLTSIHYADRPAVRAWGFDGTCEDWSLERYQREGTVRKNESETREAFRSIREFEMGFPAELCQSGVTVMDSPGTNDVPERTEVTRQAINRCDAAIVVFRSDILAGEDERKFVEETLTGTGTRVFTVINLQDGRAVDERFKGFVSRRLQTELATERGPSLDALSRDVYFVDAREAEQGKLLADPQKIEHSGLANFENKLGDFLLNERHRIHVDRFLKAADNSAATVEAQVRQRQAALRADSDRLRQALEEVEPQLTDIHRRQERLPAIFQRYRDQGVREIRAGLDLVFLRIKQSLPEQLRNAKLASDTAMSVMHQKQLMKEVYEFCERYIGDQVLAWCNGAASEQETARTVLQPLLEALLGEVQEEVAEIDRQLEDAQYHVTGWRLEQQADQRVLSEKEKMWSTVVGLLMLGDFTMVTGHSTGFRGLAFNLGAQVLAGLALGALGATGLLLLAGMIGTGMGASLLGGGIGLTQKIKDKALDDVLTRLDEVRANLSGRIEQDTGSYFDKLAIEISNEVLSAIESKERNLRAIADANRHSQSEKAEMLSSLEKSLRRVAALRQELTTLNVSLQQSA